MSSSLRKRVDDVRHEIATTWPRWMVEHHNRMRPDLEPIPTDLPHYQYQAGFDAGLRKAAEVVQQLSHEDGIGMGSQRIEQAILSLVGTNTDPGPR